MNVAAVSPHFDNYVKGWSCLDLIEHLKNLIQKELGVAEENIMIYEGENNRFWIDVLDNSFSGDMEKGDPIIEQYVLVPISKIQDRLDIVLGD